MYLVKKIARGGWSGFGTATVGIDPNTFEVLNGHPNKIPTDKIFGGVVQNQDKEGQFLSSEHNILETLNSKHYKTKQTPLHLCASGK